jgi:hypothetical protein
MLPQSPKESEQEEQTDAQMPQAALQEKALDLRPWNEGSAAKSATTFRGFTPSKAPWNLSGTSKASIVAGRKE